MKYSRHRIMFCLSQPVCAHFSLNMENMPWLFFFARCHLLRGQSGAEVTFDRTMLPPSPPLGVRRMKNLSFLKSKLSSEACFLRNQGGPFLPLWQGESRRDPPFPPFSRLCSIRSEGGLARPKGGGRKERGSSFFEAASSSSSPLFGFGGVWARRVLSREPLFSPFDQDPFVTRRRG